MLSVGFGSDAFLSEVPGKASASISTLMCGVCTVASPSDSVAFDDGSFTLYSLAE